MLPPPSGAGTVLGHGPWKPAFRRHGWVQADVTAAVRAGAYLSNCHHSIPVSHPGVLSKRKVRERGEAMREKQELL